MKIGLAIAPENALPSAFVVFRDRLDTSMAKAADLGYDGVELALLDKNQVDPTLVKRLLAQTGLALPMVSTGQVFSEARLWFTHPDASARSRAVARFKGLMETAAEFGAKVNIGRVRGPMDGEARKTAEGRLLSCLEELAAYGEKLGVELALEPVNRYEIDFINTCEDGVRLLAMLGRENIKMMPDLFHMNIEEPSIEGSFLKYIDKISYVHAADSNRHAPGRGHLDFPSITGALSASGYDGFVTVEILPYPEGDVAAREAIAYLRRFIPA